MSLRKIGRRYKKAMLAKFSKVITPSVSKRMSLFPFSLFRKEWFFSVFCNTLTLTLHVACLGLQD